MPHSESLAEQYDMACINTLVTGSVVLLQDLDIADSVVLLLHGVTLT